MFILLSTSLLLLSANPYDIPKEEIKNLKKEGKTEEQLALIEKTSASEDTHFDSVVRQDDDDATLDQIDIVVETIEKPRQQPLLFQEEAPKIKPSIQIRSVPEVQPSIDLDTKKQDTNVKPIRGGLFDFVPGFGRKKDKMDMPAEASSISTPRVSSVSGQNYDDPFESVDLPAFLRR